MKHDPATAGLQFAHYRCEQCGEQYPFLVQYAFDVLVGGVNCNGMASHGPGCRGQRWERISEAVVWPQPSQVLWELRDQLPG